MSSSPIVDAGYRLHPLDLQGAARHVVIANVTYQGIESMTPVLHFEGQSKRLVLTPEQVNQMVEITGTTLFPQWIGIGVILQPQKSKRQTSIVIKAITPKQRGQPMPVYVHEDKRGWRLSLIVVGSLIAASGLFVVFNITSLLAAIQELRANWPLR
ncbi:MAG: hypothetical protein IT328_16570 [Caldilineaceae bacterium]|nr:hypothetical protein [Caldilineaceae bacterium]